MAKAKKKTSAKPARKAKGKLKGGGARKGPGKTKSGGTRTAPSKPKTSGTRTVLSKSKAVGKRKKPSRTPRKAAPRKVALGTASQPSTLLRAVPLGLAPVTPIGRVEALEMKLDALENLTAALRAKRTHTPADDDEINPNIDALTNAQRELEAEIAAAKTQTLDPPREEDVEALREAISKAENVIQQNAAVNQLLEAATELLSTLKK